MGYQVYWANGRWQGYGVPAYCDYPGCREEIDRGMGYQLFAEREESVPETFCCSEHMYEELDSFEIEPKEHPDWLEHVLTDDSWAEWRSANPKRVEEYRWTLKVYRDKRDR